MSLLTRTIFRVIPRRFASTVGSNAQGVQDDPSSVANFVPDFTFPQGLQGDLTNSQNNDAFRELWLQKCKLFGYDNCEERLQKMIESNPTKK